MNAARTPHVSVVLIFLNGEEFLREAIESVVKQSFQDWELLLVDDGSTDSSSAIARSYVASDPSRFIYLEHDGHLNRGMSASRNLGIARSRGTFISFIDADDVWLPHKLERQVEILTSQPEAALVCGRTEWWYSWTRKPEDQSRDFLQKYSVPLDTVIQPPAVLDMFLQDEWASLCDIMVRRSAIETVGGYDDMFRGMYEDQAFHAKLCARFPVFVSSECWYRYRQHEKACTTQSHQAGLWASTRKMFLLWLESYLAANGLKHTSTWEIVRGMLFPYRHPRLVRLSAQVRRLKDRIQRSLSR